MSTELDQLYGTQLDDVLEAWKKTQPCTPRRVGCEMVDIMLEYYERTGLEGTNAISLRQCLQPDNTVGPLVVTIQLDGYKVEFEHNEDFVVPSPVCWDRM